MQLDGFVIFLKGMLRNVQIFAVKYLMYLFLIMCVVTEAVKKRKGPGKSKKNIPDGTMFGVYFCIGLLVLTFIPGLALFCYNVYKDPITPELWKRLIDSIQERTLSFLSTKEKAR